jgi:hypothetical protein
MTKKLISASLALSFLMMAAAPLAMAESTSTTSTYKGHEGKPAPVLNVSCIQSAIDTRDTAIIAAIDAYASAVKAALSTRKDALKAAWALSTRKDRRAALAAAWKNYNNAVRTARKDFKTARNSAWSQFNKDRRSCNANESEPGGGQGADATL